MFLAYISQRSQIDSITYHHVIYFQADGEDSLLWWICQTLISQILEYDLIAREVPVLEVANNIFVVCSLCDHGTQVCGERAAPS